MLFPSEHIVKDDVFHVSDAPGQDVDFNEKEAKRYSYERGDHPVIRLEDGTVWGI